LPLLISQLTRVSIQHLSISFLFSGAQKLDVSSTPAVRQVSTGHTG